MKFSTVLVASTVVLSAQAAAIQGATNVEIVDKRQEGAPAYGGSAAATEEIPTDMFSQLIGFISNFLESSFSGSGAMLSNLIG
ncbi:hypothetical protein G210_0072 [Candida maltosa Xu316]|uniref:Uncharacterized protein n=1 Tax=Candida maltosa (strain Xu316) TaxID=1245528 RepID=M3HP22_CANMX|nr:hypothetical protein G210_0072 [Candida maltosa Xu316]